MNLGRRRRKKLHLPEISLTPLIDTALVLLVIFMIATPIMHNSLNIDLPKGQMKEDAGQQGAHLVVAIDARERITLNELPYTLDGLLQALALQVRQAKENKVYVNCDQQVSSGTLVKIIDSIKYVAGVEHVVLSTERA
jgi:biopolymer transport protein ExbD